MEFTEAQIADLNQMAVEGFAYAEDNQTEEQAAALVARMTAMQADPEAAKAEAMTDMSETFTACDSNGDGFLDEAEFVAWCNVMNEKKAAKGLFCDTREATGKEYYRICKASMPDAPGINMASML